MSQLLAPESRLAALRQSLNALGVQAFIQPRADEYLGEYVPEHNERLWWLTGFTGSAGFALVTLDKAAIFVDGRYTWTDLDDFDFATVRGGARIVF